MKTAVTLSLISHTNVGKTTLARTLLRRDVGEIADRAHVTEISEAHVLIETADAVLKIWDTPGFGDTRRLIDRLNRERDPLGWLLHQVWDRIADRPLFCSQRAVRNVRDEADVVLYLVNAAEDPRHAGYVGPELEILTWMQRPVLLLLNQVGERDERLSVRWREHVRNFPIVRGVLPLDAFSRCWVEETVLLNRVCDLLDGAQRDAMRELTSAWAARNLQAFDVSCRLLAGYVARAAMDREAQPNAAEAPAPVKMLGDVTRLLSGGARPSRRARQALNERLDRSTGELMTGLIAAHELEGTSAATIEQRVQDFQVRGSTPIDGRSGAVAGAVVTGAVGGLAADALSGGLTLGGGLIAGGILGALGGSALARGYRLLAGDKQPYVSWTPEFLGRLSRQVLLRYLAVAHYGRGRGRYEDIERPAHWDQAVAEVLDARGGELERCWTNASRGDAAVASSVERSLDAIFRSSLRDVLSAAYPDARAVWRRSKSP